MTLWEAAPLHSSLLVFASAFILFLFVIALSVKSSLNQDETVAGKVAAEQTGPSQLELKPTDGVTCRHSVVVRGESERKA